MAEGEFREKHVLVYDFEGNALIEAVVKRIAATRGVRIYGVNNYGKTAGMKVLWLTHCPLPDHAVALGRAPSPRCGWMPALARALVADGRVELAVASNVRGASRGSVMVNGVRCYTIPQPAGRIDGSRLPEPLVREYQRAVEEFQPQILHIHGTEYFHGLLTGRGHLRAPAVISIQGIIDVYTRHDLAGVPVRTLLFQRTLRDWVRRDGLLEQKARRVRRAKWEREISAGNSAFIGRTRWDEAHLRRLNPAARYYHCEEVIREPFYQAQWDIRQAAPHQIFCASAACPLKGFHVLVQAAALLKKEFPDLVVRTPLAQFYPEASHGRRLWLNSRRMGYARYRTDLIHAGRLQKQVIGFSHLEVQDMVTELQRARVFVLPSFIENSPNALAEAMLVGTPAVAAFVGGVPSQACDGDSVLFFPAGDEALLAEQVRRIFRDEDLAMHLSLRARAVAAERHSVEKIVNTMVEIYETVASPRAVQELRYDD